jgi:arylformamidase
MRTYDLTITITSDMAVWPGDPKVAITRRKKIEDGDLSNVSQITMGVHTGTHVDAPYHFLKDGKTVETLPLKKLIGRAYVMHLPDSVDLITPDHLIEADIPPRTRRVLIRTRNSKIWTEDRSSFEEKYVALDEDAARYLVKRGVKLVGVDYLSVAPFGNTAPTHRVLLESDVIIVEGLNLSKVSRGRYNFYCMPLKIAGSDGAPARVILMGV